MFMSIVLWAQVAVFTHVMTYDVDRDRLGSMGRAPRTRETLPDFSESGRVIRHSRVFRRLTGSQRTPGDGASQLLHPRWRPSLLLVLKLQVMLYGCGILSQGLVLSTLLLKL